MRQVSIQLNQYTYREKHIFNSDLQSGDRVGTSAQEIFVREALNGRANAANDTKNVR